MNTKLHVRRARRAWPILVRAAANGTPITYGDLSRRLHVHWRVARWYLGVIQEHCANQGVPKLQAFAVNKETEVPGRGYAGRRGRRAHQRELDRVRCHRWSKKAPF